MNPTSTTSSRVLKTLAALLGGQGIQTLTQFFLPPLFITAYGLNGYGEWLVLSAAVGYLTTLDFGLQNYVPNQLTMLYHQGRLDDCRHLQSVGLRIMTAFLAFGTVAAATVFVMPVERWLELSLSHTEAAWCLFLLAVQILFAIAFGQFNATFRAFGQAHRGVMWANAYRIALLGVTVCLALSKANFAVIALAQVAVLVAGGAWVLLDLRRQAPALVPKWGTWDGALARTVIRQSGFFALFTLNNFLLYQLPLIAINRVLGSTEVVVFSVARMLFSSARQLVALAQGALTPEISRLFGLGDRSRLQRLYRLTESAVFSVVALVNVALFVGSPVLLAVWLKRPELFDVRLYVLLMAVGVTISVKEYKLHFQYATNTHIRASLVTSAANGLLAALLLPALRTDGVVGFAALWLALELLQLGVVHGFNHRVLGDPSQNSLWPAAKLVLLLSCITGAILYYDLFWRHFWAINELTAAVGSMAVLGLAVFILFDLRRVVRLRLSRVVG
jgi:O-antigen/teichoic acid export membrane protein